MNDMPREQSQFEQALIGAMKQIETNPITKSLFTELSKHARPGFDRKTQQLPFIKR